MKLEHVIREALIGKVVKLNRRELPLLVSDISIKGDIYQDGVVYLNPGTERYGLAFDEEFEVVQ